MKAIMFTTISCIIFSAILPAQDKQKLNIKNTTWLNSPEESEHQNKVREQLKAAEVAWKKKDLSVYSTAELLEMALIYEPSPASFVISEELTKRPEEVRDALLKRLESPLITFDVLYRIPFIAGKVDTDFQVEVAKLCLFREEMKEADLSLQIQEDQGTGIYSLIAQSKKDETAVLDKLIDEGRLERGSEFEIKWRKLLSIENREEKKNRKNDRISGREAGVIPKTKEKSGSFSELSYMVLTVVFVIVAILALLFKTFTAKRSS